MKKKTSTNDTPSEDPRNSDRQDRIESQAAMHFASRIVSAKIQEGDFSVECYDEDGNLRDEAVEEELNKWKRKFHRGVTTGEVE